MCQGNEGGFEALTETRVTESVDGHSLTEFQVPALTILAHPDAARVGERVLLPELAGRRAVRLGRSEPAFATPGATLARVLDIPHLSRKPMVLVPRSDTTEVTLERAGSPTPIKVKGEDLGERRRVTAAEIARGVVLCLGHRVVLLLHLDVSVSLDAPSFGMVGLSAPMMRLRQEARIAARLDVPVLLRGESGTGKELLARAIHDAGDRAEGPYLAINMAAVPETLAASELFGATKGAFTGADRGKDGYFQGAAFGTLFLDEIGETPADVQPVLLRVLESGEIQPVGAVKPRRVDVRVIAATDADLDELVQSGGFRRPLLHRLAGYEIYLPPLRERRADFGRLLYHFLRQELEPLGAADALETADAQRPWPPAGLVARLARLEWPGNVRQLKNVARRMAIARATGTELRLDTKPLGEPPPAFTVRESAEASHEPSDEETLDGLRLPPPVGSASPGHGWRPAYRRPGEVSEEELLTVLREHRFKLKPTAESLGISRAALYDLIAANPRIKKAADLEPGEIEDACRRTGGDVAAAAAELEVSVHGLKRRATQLGLTLKP